MEELETSHNHLQRRLDKLKTAKSALLKEIWIQKLCIFYLPLVLVIYSQWKMELKTQHATFGTQRFPVDWTVCEMI